MRDQPRRPARALGSVGKEFRGGEGNVSAEGTCSDTFYTKHLKKFLALGMGLPQFRRLMLEEEPAVVRSFVGIMQHGKTSKLIKVAAQTCKSRKRGRVWSNLYREQ